MKESVPGVDGGLTLGVLKVGIATVVMFSVGEVATFENARWICGVALACSSAIKTQRWAKRSQRILGSNTLLPDGRPMKVCRLWLNTWVPVFVKKLTVSFAVAPIWLGPAAQVGSAGVH